MRKRRTTETLVEDLQKIFGNKVEYDKVVFKNMNTPIILRCVQHDFEYTQKPYHAIQGKRSCKYCSGRGLNTEDFIKHSQEVFGVGKFDYSKTLYKGKASKITVICKKHGSEWQQNVQNHLKGNNPCQDCNGQARITLLKIAEQSKLVHGEGKFDYSLTKEQDVKNKHSKITIRCVKHDEIFIQEINTHLRPSSACPQCNRFSPRTGKKLEEMISKAENQKYDFSFTDFGLQYPHKASIKCKKHNLLFKQTINGLLSGREGCPICDKQNRLTTLDEFIERVKNIHGADKYDFDKTVLINGIQGEAVLKCVKHDEYFSYDMFRILQGLEGCKKCRTSGTSKKEKALADFVEHELGFSIERNYRKINGLSPKEVDIFIPSRNIAIEFNGLYWHSALYLDKNYHYDKWETCADAGVRLLTVWEDEWANKQDIVKSHIKHVLGLNNDEKIYARNTVVKPINKGMAQLFLNDHHIQGFVGASVHIGLFDKNDDELVAVGSFLGTGDNYQLVRFATSETVVGGFSKLINYFEKNYEYEQLITFADLGFSDGALYEKNGFVLDKLMAPDYSYIMRNTVQRFHKFGFRRERFEKDPLLMFDESLSERQLAEVNGLLRVWDCGKIRFVKQHP